jgi:hypothetical protein
MTVFADVPTIRYEGPDTANEFAYRVYDKDRLVMGKRMEEWLRPGLLLAFLQFGRRRHVRQRYPTAPLAGFADLP